MPIRLAIFRVLSALFLGMAGLVPASADDIDWVLIEARLVPQSCVKPLECIPESSLILRNLAFLDQTETRDVTLFLNRIATIRGISDPTMSALNYSTPLLVKRFHDQDQVEKLALLKNHPGVFFDSRSLDAEPESAAFAEFVRAQLSAAGLSFLSKEQIEKTPGRPRLSMRFSRHRESEGCIIPFSVSLSISEETVLARAPDLKTTSTIWSGTVRENLANRNYRPSSALRELVEKFLTDWSTAHS